MAKVLIVEDDEIIGQGMAQHLGAAGFDPVWVTKGEQGLARLRYEQPDVCVLDLMLPGRDGLEICRELRGFSDVPVVMVTARVEEIDRLVGLESGADDYVCKPFSVRELVARVKTILRRGRGTALAHGLAIDETRHSAQLDGKELNLTPVEFRLLGTLASAPGRVFSRDKLLQRLYEDHRVVTDRTVDAHVKNLRRKLEEVRPGNDPVRSIYGVGYKLEL